MGVIENITPHILGGLDLKKHLLVALLAAITPFAAAQVDTTRVVVSINGEEIKGAEYYRRMEYLPSVGKQMGRSFVEFPPGFLTLEQLITERLVFQLAKQKGVLPTDMEIDAELKIRQEQNPDLLKQWAGAGRTPEELKEVLRFELAQFKLQTFGITITNQEIEKHYRENPTEFTIPKQAKLRVIAVQTDGEKQTVEAALKGGRKFEEVAKQYSVDVTKADGGNYGTVPIGFLATPVRDAINATKIGQVTEWITSNGQEGGPTHIKFFVEDILPERKVELDEKLRREIRRKLLLNAGQVKNDVQKEMREMRTKAKIDIKQKEFAEAYQRFIEAYLKQGG